MPSPTIPSVHNIGAPLVSAMVSAESELAIGPEAETDDFLARLPGVSAMVSAESELAMGSEAETDDFLARRRWPISCMGM